MFVLQRGDCVAFAPCAAKDPQYAALVREVRRTSSIQPKHSTPNACVVWLHGGQIVRPMHPPCCCSQQRLLLIQQPWIVVSGGGGRAQAGHQKWRSLRFFIFIIFPAFPWMTQAAAKGVQMVALRMELHPSAIPEAAAATTAQAPAASIGSTAAGGNSRSRQTAGDERTARLLKLGPTVAVAAAPAVTVVRYIGPAEVLLSYGATQSALPSIAAGGGRSSATKKGAAAGMQQRKKRAADQRT